MICRVLIKTPVGQASGTEAKLRTFIVGKNSKITNDIRINDQNSEIIWEIDCDVKTMLKITRNVTMYDQFVKGVFDNKTALKAIRKLADSEEDVKKLQEMLNGQTSIEIIKEATAQEIVEGQKSWWQSMKEKFHAHPQQD